MFRAYAAEVSKASERYSSIVVCPLCRREFTEEDLALLSKDHIIPKALGGTVITVTCRRCNNRFGEQAESHLSKPFHLARFYEGDKGLVGKLTIGEDIFAAAIRKPTNAAAGLQITTFGGHPDAFARLHESIGKGAAREMSFRHETHYRSDRSLTAMVKAAYLATFRDAGYKFVFSDAGEMIRSELVAAREGRSERLLPLVGSLAKMETLAGTEPDFATFRIEISGYRFTFALLLFRSGTHGFWMFVLLPDVDGYSEGTFASRTIFQYLEEAKKQLEPYHIQMHGDGTGVTAFRLINPANNDTSDVIYVAPR